MGVLANWAQKQAKFFKLEDGEEAIVIFEGCSIEKSKFDSDKETIRYMFKTPSGVKAWDSASTYIAEFFDKVKPGQKVKIKRNGTGVNTKYDLSLEEE